MLLFVPHSGRKRNRIYPYIRERRRGISIDEAVFYHYDRSFLLDLSRTAVRFEVANPMSIEDKVVPGEPFLFKLVDELLRGKRIHLS